MAMLATNRWSDLQAPEFTERRWTREEYQRLADQGYFDNQRVELIDGRIVEMSAQGLDHTVAVEKATEFARRAFPTGYRFRGQMPLYTADGAAPEPDLAVVPGTLQEKIVAQPTWAVLVIEVSDTTLRKDRLKASLYAPTTINDYWIVNLVDGTIEVYREPVANAPAYKSVRIYQRGEFISPLGAPGASVQVDELLP